MNTIQNEINFKEKLTQFIINSSGVEDINEETELFGSGIVNSLFAIQLMMFIEKSLNIKINIADLNIENFSSISRICEFVVDEEKV